jgi:hypothetical protein
MRKANATLPATEICINSPLSTISQPLMIERTSIKELLPAVRNRSAQWREHGWIKKKISVDDARGSPMDPYMTLPPRKLADGSNASVLTDRTNAIRIFQDLIF